MKKTLTTLLALVQLASSLSAAEYIDINKDWRFIAKYGPWAERMSSGAKGQAVDLPHDWSIEAGFDENSPSGRSGGYLNGGVALYRKDDIMIPAEWSDKKIYIEFEGVYQNSDLYVNAIELGRRPNGYISYYRDITKWIDAGKLNMIGVKVTNNDMPNCRWYSGSGIYRPVNLFATDKLHVEHWGVFITTPEVAQDEAIMSVSTSIFNEYDEVKQFTLKQELLDTKGRVVADASSLHILNGGVKRDFAQKMYVDKPNLWSPDTPYIYQVRTSVVVDGEVIDSQINKCGIRKIEFKPENGFSLNDVNLKLKGVCLHHDGGLVGAAVPPMLWERRLKLLKDMGCNAIRTSHNPFEPAFYDLCDSLGIMVMDEMFDEWTVHTLDHVPNGYNKYWDEWYQQDIKDFVMRDRNHPSVVMWSAGNEIMEQAFTNGAEIARDVVAQFKKYDTTRPVTCGNNKQFEANRTGFADEFDVVGYNYGPQFGTYIPDRKSYPNRAVVGTESTRGVSTRGYYNFPIPTAGPTRNADEYFSSYDGKTRKYGMANEWKVTKELDWVAGMFIWTGIDYIGETSWPWPTKYSDFGAIDACGFPKDAFYYYRSVWNEKDVTLHLLPHWNWSGREGQVTPVWCYTSCDEVELFLNGKSQGRRSFKDTTEGHLAWNELKYEAGELRAVGYKGGKRIAETRVATTGEAAAVELELDRKLLRKGSKDVAHVTIKVVDKDGRYIANSNKALNYKIKGGKLLGIDNGDPQYVGSFKETQNRTLFNGLALLILQADDSAEKATIEVSGEGIKSASVTIDIK